MKTFAAILIALVPISLGIMFIGGLYEIYERVQIVHKDKP